ncbi:hypothetical protein IQ276_029090 [Desmonostoc muscorum LEGE 12446]|uniref:Uncharacterized protein n=1 Tax=Desmonostoc muscorum LEGE 12446 TaxID=1828758 RepID=A0A8J6ZMK7_DESMC|nr:hypothetical protein [Desmonostoc muscorum]MCF2150413.1 hypothetical protein [Desmonostoc muscorum LEGE 12446]
MEGIIRKLSELNLPSGTMVILAIASENSSATVATTLTDRGVPLGIVGAITPNSLFQVAGNTVVGYGIEGVLKCIYTKTLPKENRKFLPNK